MDNRESLWVGQIPKKWQLLKLGSLFATRNEKVSDKDFPPLSVSRGGVVPQMEGVAKTDAINDRKLVRSGDFAINSRSDRKQSCGLARMDGSVSLINTILYLKKSDIIYPEYLDFLLKNYGFAEEFYRWGHGIVADLWTTRWQEMKAIMLPIPPYEMQKRICEYLIEKSAEIDSLIAVEEAQITKLKEYRFSKTTQLVSRGMSEDVQYKKLDSPWLPSVPASWRFGKISYLVDRSHPYPIGDGDHGLVKNEDYVSKGIPFIRVLNLTWGEGLSTENIVYISEAKNALIRSSVLMPNDLLVAKTGATIGKTAIVPEWMPVSNTTSHVGKITFSPQVDTKYYFYVFNSAIILKQIQNIASMQSTRPELGNEGLKNLMVPVPPLNIQKDISTCLDELYTEISKAIEIKQNKIKLLQDFKKSLIYEYVTGKKGVHA